MDKPVQAFDAKGKLTSGKRAFRPDRSRSQSGKVFRQEIFGAVDDPQVFRPATFDGRLNKSSSSLSDEVERFDNHWRQNQTALTATEKTDPAVGFAVTLSGLLNVLDGFHAPENVVYVMTTNKVEALDPARLRPGHIDYRLFMGEASESQRVELYCRFFPEATEADSESSRRRTVRRRWENFRDCCWPWSKDGVPGT